ncbi:chlorohydrolase [Streptococcus pneumoniae]|nr:chlorohydrolase [Streptococcus pneumoniae]
MGKLLTRGFHILFVKRSLYSMKIKEQTRKLAAGCSKQCFEVVDRTDEVSNIYTAKVTLTWFEEIFEEY